MLVCRKSAWLLLFALAKLAAQPAGPSDGAAAQSALRSGDYARAERLYREQLREQPSSPELQNNLGVALHYQGKASEATVWLEKSLKTRELPPSSFALLGLDYCRAGNYKRAAVVLRQARERFSGNPEVLRILAPCFLEAGEPLDAVLVHEELVRIGAEPAGEHLARLAQACFRASKHYLGLLANSPGSDEYLRVIQRSRETASPDARGDFPAAGRAAPYLRPLLDRNASLREFAALASKHSGEAPLLYVIGVLAGERAMQTFLECERRFPDSVAVIRLRAVILAVQGKKEQAIKEYRTILDTGTASAEAHHDLGVLYRDAGDLENALAEFRAERLLAPDDERAQAGISECLLSLHRFEELRQHVKGITESESAPEWALLDLAVLEREAGQPNRAVRVLERAARQYPESPRVRYRLSQAYKAVNRDDLAAAAMRDFRRLKAKP